MIPFVGTYCGFLTMRACEQMRTFVGYTNQNVKFVGVNAGLLGGEREGVTHQFYEDLAIVSAFPNFTIFTPADPAQCYHAVRLAAETQGPVYIRGGSGREVEVYEREAPFSPEGITIWREYGDQAVLFSNGYVLTGCLPPRICSTSVGYRSPWPTSIFCMGSRMKRLSVPSPLPLTCSQ